MKILIAVILIFLTRIVFAENTIIAIVNNNPITLNSIQNKYSSESSNEEKIETIYAQIDLVLQLEKVDEFNLYPTSENIHTVLIDVAKNNNISIEQLLNFDEIDSIKKEVFEKLSILNLQRFVTKDLEKPIIKIQEECSNTSLEQNQKQIKIAQIIISDIDSDIDSPEEKTKIIKSFLTKLSKHISKGASFEAIAKLHSQHPSYKDGGVTEWLTVNNPTLVMLDSLDKNQVSEIYSTAFGFAIAIKIDERFISNKVKNCEERVIYKNAEIFYAKWLESLRKKAFIEIYFDKL